MNSENEIYTKKGSENNLEKNEKSSNKTFEKLFTATISAILAVFLAWRLFFASDWQKKRQKHLEQSDILPSLNSASNNLVPLNEKENFLKDFPGEMSENSPSSSKSLINSKSKLKSEDSDSDENSHTNLSKKNLLKGVGHLLETDAPINRSPKEAIIITNRPTAIPPPPPLSKSFEIDRRDSETIDVDKLDSPPIQISTIGVLRDKAQQCGGEFEPPEPFEVPENAEEWESAKTTNPLRISPANDYLMFGGPVVSGNPTGLINIDIPPLGFLDAIVEEDSDDLRSCQSSRASSTLYSSSSRTLSSSTTSNSTNKFSGRSETAEQISAHIEQILESADPLKKSETPLIPRLKLDAISPSEEYVGFSSNSSSCLKGETGLKHSSSSSLASSETDTVLESAQYSKKGVLSEQINIVEIPPPKENLKPGVKIKFEQIPAKILIKENRLKKINNKTMVDADRDQMEVMVQTSDQFSCFTPIEDGRISSTSMSINLDRSRDSILDQSVCSNPTKEESSIGNRTITTTTSTLNLDTRKRRGAPIQSSEKASSTSSEDEEEALPPPPETIEIGSNNTTLVANLMADKVVEEAIQEAVQTPSTYREVSPTKEVQTSTIPPKNKSIIKVPFSTTEDKIETVRPISSSVQRISSFVYGYGGHLGGNQSATVHQSSRIDQSASSNKENQRQEELRTPLGFENHIKSSYDYSKSKKDDESLDKFIDCVSPQQIFAAYELRRHPNSQSKNGRFSRERLDMEIPPSEAPPPPPKSYAESGGYRTDTEMSREDLISESDHRSRSTVREIPIQRSSSAFAPSIMSSMLGGGAGNPSSGGGGGLSSGIFSGSGSAIPYSNASTVYTSKYQNPLGIGGNVAPQQEEYYRKEVLTRTLVTRSTEALSGPPLSRSSPVIVSEHLRQLPDPTRDDVSEEYWYKYSRNVEEEERRIRENQEKRKKEEEERRQREEDQRRRWEQQELDHLERLRRERELMEKDLEYQIMEREKIERERIEKDRLEREALELRRRQEWERLERERREFEELELEKRRKLERLEKERLERERLERERLEMERLERERLQQEKIEKERVERERIERERIEIERLEIERIERIKREQREKEQKEKERQREEAERIERERLEAERLARERIELERREREYLELQRREAEQRERERREDALREQRRRQQEQRERELLEQAEREALDREMQRKLKEKMEQERLEKLRREQERLEFEQMEAERREQQRQEEERREQELIDAQLRARERREQERLEEKRKEDLRQEEERREQERRHRERIEAQERERQRIIEEQRERERVAALEAAAAERRAQRLEEERLKRSRTELERHTEELKEIERREAEKREKERLEEERRLAELRDLERRNADLRDSERREAEEREANRRREDRRSRDRLDLIVKEREECERWETEKRRLLAEREAQERKRQALTSKENLERLTRKPYYSRENLSLIGMPEVTTKVERQIIERVDRTLWTNDEVSGSGAIPLTSHQHHYSSSSTGAPLPPYTTTTTTGGSGNGLAPSLLFDQRNTSSPLFTGGLHPHQDEYSGSGTNGLRDYRERIYNPRATAPTGMSSTDDELKRGGSARTSKYKAKMEKARRDFLHQDVGSHNDPISERFQKSTEDLRRRVEYRGPLLQKFHSGEFSSSRPSDLDQPLGTTGNYSRVGPSLYDQEYRRLVEKAERSLSRYRNRLSHPNLYRNPESADFLDRNFSSDVNVINATNLRYETNLDDVHRSKSVLGGEISPNRQSRKEAALNGSDPDGAQHSRSKSADYLMDQRIREGVAPPENELQKNDSHHASNATQRREGSDWYPSTTSTRYEPRLSPYSTGAPASSTQQHSVTTYEKTYRDGVPQTSLNTRPSTLYGNNQQPWSYTAGGCSVGLPSERDHSSSDFFSRGRTPTSPPVGGISFPAGMFDKYKDEIEDLRRSRTSLHQLGTGTTPQEHTKDFSESIQPQTSTQPDSSITREYSREAFSKTDVHKLGNAKTGEQQPGYTVSTVPSDWNIPVERNSRVVEVADTFIEKSETRKTTRYGGRITAEEVLDSIFQNTAPANEPYDSGLSQSEHHNPPNGDGPGIYATNYELMDKILDQPHLAESLLQKEPLFVRCMRCNKSRNIREARRFFVSCKHCYTYYCSRDCRQQDWERHRDKCSFARINTLCKEVIMKVRRDPETQYYMSKVARDGFRKDGRGSVNIRLISAHSAQHYLKDGWKVFANHDPNQLLFYYPIESLIEQRKEPSLVHLCRKYNPNEKFILSVSIIADIEQCPETPSSELNDPNNYGNEQHGNIYSAVVPTNV